MSIREVNAIAITDAVEELCIRANTQLPPDVKQALDNAHAAEPWPLARQTDAAGAHIPVDAQFFTLGNQLVHFLIGQVQAVAILGSPAALAM